MMKKYIGILLTVLFIGCTTYSFVLSPFDIYETEGLIAFVVNAADNQTSQPDTINKECTCKGTGKEKSGDGIIETKCRCGDNCKCAKKKTKRVLLFTDPVSCSPCRKFEKKTVPVLTKKENGWTIGTESTNHIQTIDTADESNQELMQKFNIGAIPTFVLLENDKEIDRISGYLSPKDFTDFFLKERN